MSSGNQFEDDSSSSSSSSFNAYIWSLIVNDEKKIAQTLSSINDSIVIDQILSSVSTSMSSSSSTSAIPMMNDGSNGVHHRQNDDILVDRPSWTTRIVSNNDDTVSMQCSQLFTNSATDIMAVNDTSIMANITNITSLTANASFKLGQLSQQLTNQSQLLFNETWLLSNLAANVHDDDLNASSSSSSATSIIMSQNSSSSSFYCDAVWDGFYCWPMTTSGTILMRSCRDIFDSVGELPKDQIDESTYNNSFAYRICDNNGTWIKNWTNYTECLMLIANNESDPDAFKYQFIRQLVIFIMFSCSILSLILLSITFFIFTYFRSLTSCRLRVHRNLVLALILHSICLLLIASPHLFNPDESLSSYWEIEWLCKSILTLKLYSTLASINWMFIEGFQLHSRVTVSILRRDAPFKLYHFLGWGIPLVLVAAWALQMSLTMDTLCWNGYAHSLYIWIIVGPMILALSVNCIFLVNIIRVLLTKLRLTVTMEIKQIRKAIKATALLFPLLGISHLLFCINPDDNGRLEDAYLIFNAFLQSSQGIFVSILYCFMDTDVQQALKLTYQRTVCKNGSYPSRYSRQTTNITSTKTPNLRDRNLGSFKFTKKRPIINNLVRTNSLNETTMEKK
ncbi:LOW QUALITY PROTEIN: corticotropin-releasing factor receptor 2-like [Dermatophagoides pteronyssinus]|uniref:LOW QUALITY PROTEIN: corticotropin-releasing factor receptor 2-like n=1 Tax=Dermatophagoides pteronyssinus TaxID=6956 RepID=UPI003F671BD7